MPTEVETAMEQKYAVKGSRDDTVMVVWEPDTVLCMVAPLPVSVMLMVYTVIIPFWSSSLGGLQVKMTERGDWMLSMNI